MPFKTLKQDTADALTLEWVLQVKDYKLTLDKKRCVGCQVCSLACPKEAIKTIKEPKIEGQKTKKAKVDIDLAKCNFCGICDVTCPYGAISITVNGSHDLSIIEKESYPKLIREFVIDTRKCEKECDKCEEICPLSLIKISRTGFDGRPIQDIQALSPVAKKRVQLDIDIQKDYCPTCKLCELECSQGALSLRKVFEGKISIDKEKCPEGCKDCLDVCPIPGALVLCDDKKIHANESICTFCGACKNVCPVDEALCVKRTKVCHTPIHSGTWNKALERITSPADANKELKAQAAECRRKVIEKRFLAEDLKTENYT
jgi:4Fe-4S ferredoxin